MDLYRPPLLEKSRNDNKTAPTIKEAVKGVKLEFHYTGQRVNRYLIDLTVFSLIEDNSDNLFLRLCTYSGLKDKWKEVIINHVRQHLRDLDVEEGFVRSETRYLEVTSEQHHKKDAFEKLYSNFEGKIYKKKNENNPL